jgi:hypothetical protein
MIAGQVFDQALQELVKKESSTITVGDYSVYMKVHEGATIVTLSTTVYRGSGYIPKSVRNAMGHPFPAMRSFHTELRLNEEECSIYLHFRGSLEGTSKKDFHDLIEEFVLIADEWNQWLDDHDKKDRVRVPKN